MAELERSNRNPAYLCGRLLAVLENIQEAALGEVNQSIVDRYYSAASSAPALAFGRLLDGAQKHLAKLDRDKHGVFVALDTRLGEILSGIDGATGFPKTLTLREQGLFALGYYHQRTERFRRSNPTKDQRPPEAGADATPASKPGPEAPEPLNHQLFRRKP